MNSINQELFARVREAKRRELWKSQGVKSLKEYCEVALRLNKRDIREIFLAHGLILTEARMKDTNPLVQRRIDSLKEWRKRQATKLDLAPYMVISNRTLMAIAKTNPQTLAKLLEINGIGPRKLKAYGRNLLKRL